MLMVSANCLKWSKYTDSSVPVLHSSLSPSVLPLPREMYSYLIVSRLTNIGVPQSYECI